MPFKQEPLQKAVVMALTEFLQLMQQQLKAQDVNNALQKLQEIKAALQIIAQKMPFLIVLTAQERRKLFKMGDKSLAFVTNSVNVAQSNREILPASFDIEE